MVLGRRSLKKALVNIFMTLGSKSLSHFNRIIESGSREWTCLSMNFFRFVLTKSPFKITSTMGRVGSGMNFVWYGFHESWLEGQNSISKYPLSSDFSAKEVLSIDPG